MSPTRTPSTAPGTTPSRRGVLGALLDTGALLTTPLLPDDFLGIVNPLWTARELRARVEQVRPEASGAATLVLRPGRGWTGHTAGQWVRVGVQVDGVLHWRSYSLTCPQRADGTIAITVKAMADGFVSRHLVRATPPGTVLRLAPAAGDFVLPTELTRPLLMITAGSGITPVMGMLRSLAEGVRPDGAADGGAPGGDELVQGAPGQGAPGRGAPGAGAPGALPDIVLVHSALTPDDVIFGPELRALAAQHPRFRLVERHTDLDGLLTVDQLCAAVPDWREREAWACGPAGLLDAVEQHWEAAGLRGLLHTERFRPKLVPDLAGTAGGGTATFSRTGTTVAADGATPLLDAGEAAGVLLPSGCRMGICFSCVVPLRAGQVRDLRTGEVHGDEGDLIQTCVSAAAGTCEIDA
jgi:stearoyl-CoA 9-desaturase NADPH oxidoreductase